MYTYAIFIHERKGKYTYLLTYCHCQYNPRIQTDQTETNFCIDFDKLIVEMKTSVSFNFLLKDVSLILILVIIDKPDPKVSMKSQLEY